MKEKLLSQKRILGACLIVALCMTATPVVILANRIEPFVLGMPLFLAWNIIWPMITFLFAVFYGKVCDKLEDLQDN